MRAVVKSIHCADIPDLEGYYPDLPDNSGFYLELGIGPKDSKGEEIFGLTICTPQWLMNQYPKDDVILGRHHLIVFEYDYKRIIGKIEKFLLRCNSDTWHEVTLKVGELGRWEFEDYQP